MKRRWTQPCGTLNAATGGVDTNWVSREMPQKWSILAGGDTEPWEFAVSNVSPTGLGVSTSPDWFANLAGSPYLGIAKSLGLSVPQGFSSHVCHSLV